MAERDVLHANAQHCRNLAKLARSELAAQLLTWARDFDAEADALPRDEDGDPGSDRDRTKAPISWG